MDQLLVGEPGDGATRASRPPPSTPTATGLPGPVRADQIGLWRSNIEQRLIAEGVQADVAAVEASLVKAMFTGLVVDLLATGERRRLTRALEVGLARLEQVVWASAGLSDPAIPARPNLATENR